MKKFNLSEYLENPNHKVITRERRKVRIICWDRKDSKYPIIGLISNENGLKEDGCCFYAVNGDAYGDACYDLFFANEEEETIDDTEMNSLVYLTELGYTCIPPKKEEELTEFEKVVDNIINYPHFQDEQAVKQFSKTLLDLARKELEPELDKKLKESYNQGGLYTQEEITKCLPKWKKIPHGISRKELLDMMYKHIVLAFNDCVDYYYLDESDLRKLPKEE